MDRSEISLDGLNWLKTGFFDSDLSLSDFK
jgi:hypothetical protein